MAEIAPDQASGILIVGGDSPTTDGIVADLIKAGYSPGDLLHDVSLQRYLDHVQNLFDPEGVQAASFETGWEETPGVDSLRAQGVKLLQDHFTCNRYWVMVEPRCGAYYPFLKSIFGLAGVKPKVQIVIERGVRETWGAYAHRLLSSLFFCDPERTSLIQGDPQACEGSGEMVRPILDFVLRISEKGRDLRDQPLKEEIGVQWEAWISGGQIANAYHRPGRVLASWVGEKDHKLLQLETRTFAGIGWRRAKFPLGISSDGRISLMFFPEARVVFLRDLRLVDAEGNAMEPELKPEGITAIESLGHGELRLEAFGDRTMVWFNVPERRHCYELEFEYQIRDDDFAVRSMVNRLSSQVIRIRTGRNP